MMSDSSSDQAFTAGIEHALGLEATYAGAVSLFRRTYSKRVDCSDIIASGVPFDLAVTNRPGTRFGPRGIRIASCHASWSGATWPWKLDPFEHLTMTDYGDCEIDHGFPDRIPAQIQAHARHLLSHGAKILTLGGDHFIAYPILKSVSERCGPVSLIHFDAHSDTWSEPQERIDHGTMFYHAARQRLVIPEQSVQIGLRTWNPESHGFQIMDAEYVHRHGVEHVIERTLSIVGDNPAYLSFDIDCLDPAFAPGTGTPVCGGLSTFQAQSIIRGLVPIDFVGMDLVEVSPPYDHGEVTSLAGASLILDFICLLATRKLLQRCSSQNERE